MATQRRYSIEFKRQIVQEYQGGETLHGLAKQHGISRNLVRIWAAKAEAGEFDDDLAVLPDDDAVGIDMDVDRSAPPPWPSPSICCCQSEPGRSWRRRPPFP